MRLFERFYLACEPFLPYIYQDIRKRLLSEARSFRDRPDVLDVGGRKSHYTIGLPARITITDISRESELQNRLNLGINPAIVDGTIRRRSNVYFILFDDITKSSIVDTSFDIVVAVEVLEHVEEDADFVREVYRILRPGGTFLMTTPNGDYVPNTNPDHKRHYTREGLVSLLASVFDAVEVDYAVKAGTFHRLGLRSWSIRRPWRTLQSMAGNLVNAVQSAPEAVRNQSRGTCHLIAKCNKFKN